MFVISLQSALFANQMDTTQTRVVKSFLSWNPQESSEKNFHGFQSACAILIRSAKTRTPAPCSNPIPAMAGRVRVSHVPLSDGTAEKLLEFSCLLRRCADLWPHRLCMQHVKDSMHRFVVRAMPEGNQSTRACDCPHIRGSFKSKCPSACSCPLADYTAKQQACAILLLQTKNVLICVQMGAHR